MNDSRVAAAIFNSPVGKNRENLNRMADWIAAASKQGAAIICFPELCISGYCTRDEIRSAAEPIPGETSEALSAAAREFGVVVIGSVFEQRAAGLYHNSAVVFDVDGSLARALEQARKAGARRVQAADL